MATFSFLLLAELLALFFIPLSVLSVEVPASPLNLAYHHGSLLSNPQPIKLFLTFYGHFEASERSTLKAFLASLNPSSSLPLHRRSLRGSLLPVMEPPSVASWWSLTRHYYDLQGRHVSQTFELAREIDDNYSLGKQLTASGIAALAQSPTESFPPNSLSLVFTSADVAVDGFCMHACGGHSFFNSQQQRTDEGVVRMSIPYLWVGNPEMQCPGYCAWPFAKQQYGPPMEALKAPNGIGVDGMIITMAKLLVGAVTNPVGNGYFEGDDASFGREAGEVCTGKFGLGAYPGYPGELMLNPNSGTSFNMEGSLGKQFLVPWIWNRATLECGGQP